MITSAIKIDDEQWAEWLDAVAATPKIRHIECDAALFSFSLDFLKSLDRHSLYGAHARDILPPETARFLNESPNDQAFNNLRKSIIHSMLSAENAGVSHFSLQMRLDEPFPDEENRVRKTAAFLRKLLLTPLEKPFKLDLQIRFPYQYPQSKEWERARDICDMADSKRIGLSLSSIPATSKIRRLPRRKSSKVFCRISMSLNSTIIHLLANRSSKTNSPNGPIC